MKGEIFLHKSLSHSVVFMGGIVERKKLKIFFKKGRTKSFTSGTPYERIKKFTS